MAVHEVDLPREVQARGADILVLDGLVAAEARLNHFIVALTLEFRAMGMTTLFTNEVDLIGPADLPLSGLSLRGTSDIAENIVVLRFVELRARLHRMISVIKVRDSDFEQAMRGYAITEGGIIVDGSAERAEAILAEALGQTRRFAPNHRGGERRGRGD